MNHYIENNKVEETKHIVPNLTLFYKSIFGEDAILIPHEITQVDWITKAYKRNDGAIWLPWRKEFWVIEVEWKENSNFLQQSRSFTKSKNEPKDLREKMEFSLSKDFRKSLDELDLGNAVVKGIVDNTLQKYSNDKGNFCPCLWLVLGHEFGNSSILLEEYKEEITQRFSTRNDKQWIITTVRMFSNSLSCYFLLENKFPDGCSIRPDKSILVKVQNFNLYEKNSHLSKEPSNDAIGHPIAEEDSPKTEVIRNSFISSSGKEEWKLEDFRWLKQRQLLALKYIIESDKDYVPPKEISDYIGTKNIGGTLTFTLKSSKKEELVESFREGKRVKLKYRELVQKAIKEYLRTDNKL